MKSTSNSASLNAPARQHRMLQLTATAAISLTLLVPLTANAQDSDYAAPRTVDGAPDLQGMWTSNTITPFTRPEEFGDKLILNREEAMLLEQGVADYTAEQDLPSDPDRIPPAKDRIELADSYNNFWFDDGTRVARYNGEYRSSLLIDPPNGRMPAYTPEAEERLRVAAELREVRGPFAGPESRPLAERCLMSFGSSSGPPMLPILYNNHYQIVQSPGYVMILVEMVHDARIIRIDADPLPDAFRPWMGDSVGRWEGDTLVVETSRLNPSQKFRNSTENFRITERFTRVSDTVMNYSFTAQDPDTFVQPFSAEMPMNLTDDILYEYACHEGNYSLPGVLAGARLDEAQQTN
ncbi:MAG: hypothetical protein COB20_00030 [SAR86 cluster bacterium]|uniref:DUF1329 domain-containing protein n=1 Tax=SAR86 cluster bacterium TaxID=2030880 RepID=A0A2A4XJU1_9GAMM|nr:MAG: hypothetical protein COB20_00030 [SAR86 cluster bacterium]